MFQKLGIGVGISRMLEKNLATIIIPIYNGERYLPRFLDSLYKQTYNQLQIILVNDGSSDQTDAIIKRNQKRFEDKFFSFEYISQKNGGAAKACNTALKYVRGEFLSWADCDDWLYEDNIKKKVEFLKRYRDYALVTCQAEAIDFDTNERIGKLMIDKESQKEDVFWTILKGLPCYPGVFTIVTKKLFDIIPDREIPYNPECGQNYQLLLPVAYHNKCGYINECLYQYYVRPDSHSHNTDYKREIKRSYIIEQILEQTLSFIERYDRDEYIYIMNWIHNKFLNRRLSLAFNADDVKLFNDNYLVAKEENVLNLKMKLKKLIINKKIFYKIYGLCKK